IQARIHQSWHIVRVNDEYPLTPEQITNYRRDGFIQLNDVITGTDLAAMREAITTAVKQESAAEDPKRIKSSYEQIFIQKVNLWTRHPTVRPFILSKRFADIAHRLSGSPIRLWHDQALFKEP